MSDSSRDFVAELCEMVEAAGLRISLDFNRDVTKCAVCGARSPRPQPPQFHFECWSIELPWLGSCRVACSVRCERIAIEWRDAP